MAIDYDKNAPTTRDFYAMIQNRFHYAITEQTAAEIIYSKADHTKEHMGLTTWKNAPDGRIFKSFLTFRRYQILPDKGRISAAQAKQKAEEEYDIFNKTQRIDSDFDKEIKQMLDNNTDQ